MAAKKKSLGSPGQKAVTSAGLALLLGAGMSPQWNYGGKPITPPSMVKKGSASSRKGK
jgi:hypothetical protein